MVRRGARTGMGRRVRVRLSGDERAAKSAELAMGYRNRMSIRRLAEDHGLSYGLTRTLLLASGVVLRNRGGARAKAPR